MHIYIYVYIYMYTAIHYTYPPHVPITNNQDPIISLKAGRFWWAAGSSPPPLPAPAGCHGSTWALPAARCCVCRCVWWAWCVWCVWHLVKHPMFQFRKPSNARFSKHISTLICSASRPKKTSLSVFWCFPQLRPFTNYKCLFLWDYTIQPLNGVLLVLRTGISGHSQRH